jgi:hypothetical protein
MSDIVVEPVFGILMYTRFGFALIKFEGTTRDPSKLLNWFSPKRETRGSLEKAPVVAKTPVDTATIAVAAFAKTLDAGRLFSSVFLCKSKRVSSLSLEDDMMMIDRACVCVNK